MSADRVLILGTAGTGKTYYLSKRISDILSNLNSGFVVGMTKTNAAKNVLRDRVVEVASGVIDFYDTVEFARKNIRTISSFSLDVVNFPRNEIDKKIVDVIIENSLIMRDFDKIYEMVEKIGLDRKKINPYALSVKTYPGIFSLKGNEIYFYAIKTLLSSNDWKDYRSIRSEDIEKFIKSVKMYFKVYYRKNLDIITFENVYDKFVNFLEKNGYETFDTILIDAVNNLKNSGNMFDYVFVDEANELSYLDYKFVVNSAKNVYFAMDPFQTIYNVLPLTNKTYNEILNYVNNKEMLKIQRRCSKKIFEFAKRFFFSNVSKFQIRCGLGDFGETVYEYLSYVESERNGGFVSNLKINKNDLEIRIRIIIKSEEYFSKEISVLTRRKTFEKRIKRKIGYPCSSYGTYIDAIIDVIERIKYSQVMIDEIKHLMKPKTYKECKLKGIEVIDSNFLNKVSLERFLRNFFELDRKDYELIKDVIRTNERKRIIEVKTIHESKGSEYDTVILVKDIGDSFYNKVRSVCLDVYLQEIFILFCGITRASEKLYFIELHNRKV